MSNQHGEPSFLCSEQVKVMYEDGAWNTRWTIANLEEISASSATLLSDECPQPWTAIIFSAKGYDLRGTVESVEVDEVLGYFIKIKLDPLHPWQKRLFVPDHCLALGRSIREPEVKRVGTSRSFTLAGR